MSKNYRGMASKLEGRRRVVCAGCGEKVKAHQIVMLTEHGILGGNLPTCEKCRVNVSR